VTAFVSGHSYAEPGEFSNATKIIDLDRQQVLGDLEDDFTVQVDGEVLDARDRNFWGLTFAADGDTFYATAASGGQTWLIKGSIAGRSAHAIHENVECPSLSPDGTRIAYKKAIATDPSVWRFHVLDLATGRETELAEERSIDDQLAWLDDEHLLYADGDQTTWVVRADGTGVPERWLEDADSATVTRPGS
jgi:Tol biopolymer transport system component